MNVDDGGFRIEPTPAVPTEVVFSPDATPTARAHVGHKKPRRVGPQADRLADGRRARRSRNRPLPPPSLARHSHSMDRAAAAASTASQHFSTAHVHPGPSSATSEGISHLALERGVHRWTFPRLRRRFGWKPLIVSNARIVFVTTSNISFMRHANVSSSSLGGGASWIAMSM